jgi:hypothetical protein
MNMGVYFDSNDDKAKLRALYVDGLEDRSYAGGGGDLGDGSGRFVGLAPEAQIALGKELQTRTLDNQVQGALNEQRAFEYQGTLYVPVQDKSVGVNQ